MSSRAARRRGRRLARVLLVLLLSVLVGATSFVGGLLAAPADFGQDLLPEPRPVTLLADDGATALAAIQPTTRREVVPGAAIPEVMRQAIISAEDERFLDHGGVDPLATIRAAYRDLSGGRTQGGSTLTQQYVKNAYVGNERTLLRKVREAALAVRLEEEKPKSEILTDYLNALYLGNGVYGVQAAARYYFGVDVSDLDLDLTPGRGGPRDSELELARASLLAGIAPAPSAWNPVKDMETAKSRQKYTLNRMVVNGFVSPQEASGASLRGVEPVRETPPEPPTSAPEFTDLVKTQLREQFRDDEDVLFRGGLQVTTSLNADLQQAVSRAAAEVLPDADDPQAAVVGIDIRNGDVKALTTLRRSPARVDTEGRLRPAATGYQRNGYNLATNALRPSGSTIKTFTLAEALEQGQSLDTPRWAPERDSIPNPAGKPDPYVYGNSEPGESGTYTLRRALALSINTAYLPLANELGRAKVAARAEAAGLRGKIKPGNISFGIGAGVEVSPLSMANAYATVANHGVRMTPRLYTQIRTSGVPGSSSRVLDQAPERPQGSRVMSAEVADRVTEALRDVVTRGTARAAAQPFEVFGKTGTTNGSTDAWWVGCARSPQNLCLAVWMGHEYSACTGVVDSRACGGMRNVHGVRQVYGGTLPARVFARSFEILREIQSDRAAPRR